MLELFDTSSFEQLRAFATSLAIGLLVGLERERKPDARAGLRTFALTALLGTLAALIGEKTGSPWVIAAGLLAVAAMMIVSQNVQPQENGDPGTTSVIAMMLTYGLGAAVWLGHGALAVMLAISMTVLLYFKAFLHGFTQRLTHTDLISILQFGVLSFIILPILPNHDLGPYGAFNPYQIWKMVVLISGVSLAGYAALRLVGTRHGTPLLGFFGGLVSSTATTMVFARHARSHDDMVRTATVVILLANLMVMLRLSLVSAVVSPLLMLPVLLVLGAGFLCGLAVTLWCWRGLVSGGEMPMPEVTNPTEVRAAVSFGLLYGGVLFLSAWLQDIAGAGGLFALSFVSGLTDVDAITLSSLRLFNTGKLPASDAVLTIAIAVASNLVFKSGLVMMIGGPALARRTLPGMLAIALGMGLGLLLH